MKRIQAPLRRLTLPRPKPRPFTHSSQAQFPRHHDTEGRTPGFARRRRNTQPRQPPPTPAQDVHAPKSIPDDAHNSLLSTVNIPSDPNGILQPDHPATSILSHSSLIVQRQIEMMNVFLGFEQANKYVIMDPKGNHVGFLAETDGGMGSAMKRQFLRTHRSFTTHVFDRNEREVMRFHRPTTLVSSAIRVYDAMDASTSSSSDHTPSTSTDITTRQQLPPQVSPLPLESMRLIGEAQQSWAPLRRNYNLFLARNDDTSHPTSESAQLTSGSLPLSTSKALQVSNSGTNDAKTETVNLSQFASVREPFLSPEFSLRSQDGQLIGSVSRNFTGWAREIFTDTGVYALRMDAAGQPEGQGQIEGAQSVISTSTSTNLTTTSPADKGLGMTLDARAVMLATAVSIDFDYYSRHSGSVGGFGGGGFMPLWFPMPFGWGGGGAAAEGAAGAEGAVGEAGAAGGTLERAGGAAGAGEGAIAGAGSLAGYEAMQRAREGRTEQGDELVDDPADGDAPNEQDPWGQQGGDPWGEQSQQSQDPWGQQGQDPWGGGGGGGGDGGGGGGGFDDFF